ncbi:MAG: SDR family oxidoreductase [Chloroflexi bacterium]|uniref:SDR family oxidoreductase n=1 Tax=Candidatus Chlorohelix allophototropha TaxID=3003348 RepID=A0A8T7M859_9CHLR|nr:SDR family oxidoreductase [Chloroflexota bacterium]WJW68152.1 SDR family oxidoreductase [Chloroflexota bacterium L227-S17]
MTDRLAGKVALITGAGNGIGRITARLFASESASVVISDRLEADLKETERLITSEGGKVTTILCDVTKAAQVQASVNLSLETYGKLNILVNNAGIGRNPARITELSEEDWDITLNVNLKGVFLGMKYAIPAMKKQGGSIINLASVAGIVGTPKLSAYGASKAGVIQLSKTAALEWARYGIRVNAVCPSWTKTNMVDLFTNATPNPQATEQGMASAIPLGRLGQPEEIANAILFLASDDSSFITGATLPVDGGLAAM